MWNNALALCFHLQITSHPTHICKIWANFLKECWVLTIWIWQSFLCFFCCCFVQFLIVVWLFGAAIFLSTKCPRVFKLVCAHKPSTKAFFTSGQRSSLNHHFEDFWLVIVACNCCILIVSIFLYNLVTSFGIFGASLVPNFFTQSSLIS